MKKLEQKKSRETPGNQKNFIHLKDTKNRSFNASIANNKKICYEFMPASEFKISTRRRNIMRNKENDLSPTRGREKQTKIELYCAIFATLSQAPFEKEVKI